MDELLRAEGEGVDMIGGRVGGEGCFVHGITQAVDRHRDPFTLARPAFRWLPRRVTDLRRGRSPFIYCSLKSSRHQ